MEHPRIGQHVTLDPAAAAEVEKAHLAAETWTVEHVRPSKQDAFLVSTADAREGKLHMRRLERVPFAALVAETDATEEEDGEERPKCWMCDQTITDAHEDAGTVFMDGGTGPGVDVCSDECADNFYKS
ncbi:hypothetical protein SEA_JAMUN_32 [Arthrobacter phage Jamun]|nr:hypothetical protein SEA_JAMUN_32 [Arthrobacter phage Jamun]